MFAVLCVSFSKILSLRLKRTAVTIKQSNRSAITPYIVQWNVIFIMHYYISWWWRVFYPALLNIDGFTEYWHYTLKQEGPSMTMNIVWNIASYRSVHYYIIAYDVWLREYSLTYLLVLAWLTVDFYLALLDRRYSTYRCCYPFAFDVIFQLDSYLRVHWPVYVLERSLSPLYRFVSHLYWLYLQHFRPHITVYSDYWPVWPR